MLRVIGTPPVRSADFAQTPSSTSACETKLQLRPRGLRTRRPPLHFSLSLILFSVRRFFNLLQIVRWRQHFWRTLFLQGGYRGLLPPMK